MNAGDNAPAVKLACRNVWKVYGSRPGYYFDTKGYQIDPAALAERMRSEEHIPAVVDASFSIHVGEIFVIMGLSGSGKSTLVRCLSRLVEPSAGEILLDGNDLLKTSDRELVEIRRHAMGMVFQNFGLLPHLSVLDNVAFPLRIQGRSLSERQKRAQEMIALVGLGAGKPPSRTSFQAVSSSAWVSPARSPSGPGCGSSTSRFRRSIP